VPRTFAPGTCLRLRLSPNRIRHHVDLHPVHPWRLDSSFSQLSLRSSFACGPWSLPYWRLRHRGHEPLQVSVIFGALAVCTGLLASSVYKKWWPGRRHRIPTVTALLHHGRARRRKSPFCSSSTRADFWARDWACLKTGIPLEPLRPCLSGWCSAAAPILSPSMTGAATGPARRACRHQCPRASLPELLQGISWCRIGGCGTGAHRRLLYRDSCDTRNTRAVWSAMRRADEETLDKYDERLNYSGISTATDVQASKLYTRMSTCPWRSPIWRARRRSSAQRLCSRLQARRRLSHPEVQFSFHGRAAAMRGVNGRKGTLAHARGISSGGPIDHRSRKRIHSCSDRVARCMMALGVSLWQPGFRPA